MNTPARLGTYLLGIAVVFGTALGAGQAAGAAGLRPETAEAHDAAHTTTTTQTPAPAGSGASVPGGLQVSQNGYTLTPETTTVEPGRATDFRFTVTGPDGGPVTGYQVKHDKKLHFIVVSRDLADFQHLHPQEAGNGVWSVRLTLPEAGVYRAFADFAPEGGEGLTLGADLRAPGDYTPKALPRASRTATVDGYTVTLDGDLVPGRSSRLTLSVAKDGRPVTDLQPYLGAYGHLVALRGGDLAYLHVHPDGEPGDGRTAPGPGITFYAEVPSSGDYRLFLDFQHAGVVRTADFTVRAGQAAPGAATPGPESGPHGEHTH
ncbi:hypothetical protein [Streptosporangium carneum]|uniref:Heavy metal-binding domain-containing protein n=1 Tax=Streptosporangium carneum TaxID=47481 RepID=A0A9W6ICB6_9ACTN|nr:hypothetical protein [Streptosporangium carneum]GLK15083.1 hypothetical protein GCM10017600_84960 [Streptosporangium carneum]